MEQLTVTIMGREYRVACRPEERDELLACAQYVDRKMAGVRDSGKVLGADRIAVLVALQLAQELFGMRNSDGVPIADLAWRARMRRDTASTQMRAGR